ncbi:hypothetical protein COY62_04430 [bacterium (Candidatus Howlettbacteria) CG_4_10_14_0_8_um_filter_40_9]|nr:MAG: hypothetical protein COY62_04430 [bacterium (Candidatus Howlettbacteria) CG_4_10_14_0_8_um_filter_40_9]
MSVIEIKDLKKYYGKTKAVDGVSFEIKKGEVFGFLGPNGAGKTTTIRCLMDFIRPTEGSISILGKDLREESVFLKSKIGYLPGNVKLYDKWTGKEHISFVESIRGKSRPKADQPLADTFAKELTRTFGFDPKKKFKQLSSGNKQKLGLILALMSEPEILIMDEPTLGLDPLLQNTIYEILEKLKEKGTTIFISSHNLPEVERICDRVGIIKDGKMVSVEAVSQLGEKKLHRVQARFAGKYDIADFKKLKIENLEEISGGVIFTVGGDLNIIIKKLFEYKIVDLEVSHATLEDVFLKFYKKK